MRMPDGTTQQARPDVAAFLAFLNAQEGPKMEELPPAGAREMFRVMGQFADVPRGDIAKVEDRTIPGPVGDLPIRDRKSVVEGTSVSVRVTLGGSRIMKN